MLFLPATVFPRHVKHNLQNRGGKEKQKMFPDSMTVSLLSYFHKLIGVDFLSDLDQIFCFDPGLNQFTPRQGFEIQILLVLG